MANFVFMHCNSVKGSGGGLRGQAQPGEALAAFDDCALGHGLSR